MLWKDDSIKWLNGLNNATIIISKRIENGSSMDEIKKAIEDLANWYYRLKPQGGEIEERIKACNSRDELNSLKDDISKTKDSSLYTAFNEKIIELAAREGLTK